MFLRSPAGDDPGTSLWVYNVASGTEREVAGARQALGEGGEQLPDEERARRERSRELAGGITAYACDEAVRHAAFALSGRLWWVALEGEEGGGAVELPAPSGVVDPHPDPSGEAVAFLSGPALYVVPTTGDRPPLVIADERGANGPADVTWGAAEFIAAEEMDRLRGFWWAPDGRSLLAARVDNSPVPTWWTGDPSEPGTSPRAHRYPAAGEADALVSLWHLEPAAWEGATPGGGSRKQVTWDCERYPYMVAVHWSRSGPPLVLVEQRDHKACAVLSVDLARGTTKLVAEMGDRAWVDWPLGVPAWLDDGELLWATAEDGTWRLEVGDDRITPPGLQVREVTSAGRSVVFTASSAPEVVEAWSWSRDSGLRQLTDVGGISRAVGDGDVKVVVSRSMAWHGTRAQVEVARIEVARIEVARIKWRSGRRLAAASLGEQCGDAGCRPGRAFFQSGPGRAQRRCRPADRPRWRQAARDHGPLRGPGAQMVQAARSLWLEAQWLADQGFAVVVADGRGTPGRGPDFEREVYLDLAGPPLEDQVKALQGVATEVDELDLRRVGIKGWSFGGYLAAAGRARQTGRLPRRLRWSPGHRLALVRHLLHGTFPRAPPGRPARVRTLLASTPGPRAPPATGAGPRAGRRQRLRSPHPRVVERVAGRRSPALGPAAARDDPHSSERGCRREPSQPRKSTSSERLWPTRRSIQAVQPACPILGRPRPDRDRPVRLCGRNHQAGRKHQADASRPPSASSKRRARCRRTSRRSSSASPPNTPYWALAPRAYSRHWARTEQVSQIDLASFVWASARGPCPIGKNSSVGNCWHAASSRHARRPSSTGGSSREGTAPQT